MYKPNTYDIIINNIHKCKNIINLTIAINLFNIAIIS